MSAAYRLPTNLDRSTTRRRATGLALAIGLELLIVLALLGFGAGRPPVPIVRSGALTIDFIPNTAIEPEPAQTRRQRPNAAKPTPVAPRPLPPRPRIILPTPRASRDLPMLVLTPRDYAAADIAKLGSKGIPAPADDGGDSSLAEGAGDSERVGTAPNGQPLYAAAWYREPTNQELAGYLPKRMPDNGGWGLVACKTVPGYRVDDCIELGNSPPGSRLASAVRQAAWQFRVRPPRKGGRDMVGEWVRIRIEYQIGRTRVE